MYCQQGYHYLAIIPLREGAGVGSYRGLVQQRLVLLQFRSFIAGFHLGDSSGAMIDQSDQQASDRQENQLNVARAYPRQRNAVQR